MTRQKKHRLKRRALGLCGTEGCNETSQSYYCDGCRLRRRVTWKRWYETNKDRLKNARVVAEMLGDGEK